MATKNGDLDTSGRAIPGDTPEEPSLLNWAQTQILRTDKLFRLALVLVITLLTFTLLSILLQLLSSFAGLLLLFISAWLIALLLTPVARLFVGLGAPKVLAVVASYVLVLGAFGLFLRVVLPDLIAQTQDLIGSLSSITNELQKVANDLLKNLGVTGIDINQFTGALQTIGTDVLKNALNTITGLAGFLVQALLVAIISFSLLIGRNFEQARDPSSPPYSRSSMWNKLPPSWREFYVRLLQSLERNFGVFLLGQVVVAMVYGIVVGMVMSFTGFQYAVTTACLCGLLMIIPFFGGPLSLLPPLLVGVGSSTGGPIIVVLIILFVIQTALLNVVLPKLVGSQAGIGPVLTLFVLLAGAQIGGIFGVLLAVPLAGVVKNMLEYLLVKIEEPAQNGAAISQTVKITTPAPAAPVPDGKPPAEVISPPEPTTVAEPPSQVEIAIETLVKSPDE